MQMTSPVQHTTGVVLDPFSILFAGAIRKKIAGTKQQVKREGFLDILHGEAKFKQAFINACHFADSMSVAGPVCQLNWGSFADPCANAMFWKAPLGERDNSLFFDTLKNFSNRNAGALQSVMSNIPAPEGLGDLVHVMPDCTLQTDPGNLNLNMTDFNERVIRHIYDEPFNDYLSDRFVRGAQQPNATPAFVRGTPVVALMAVTFTFKKPYGISPSSELTNLGGWPPVCFLLPVLVPQGSTLATQGYYGSDLRSATLKTQPSLMSYQIRIRGGHSNMRRTVPFGQPFKLTSVNKWGKTPDVLRSLSDVFKTVWSQAAQYCAWNLRFDWAKGEIEDSIPSHMVAELGLDPLGAGRRIRGHNRHASKYDMHGVSMYWESDLPSAMGTHSPIPTQWNGEGFGRSMDPIQEQASRQKGHTAVFVLPSFFSDATKMNLRATAFTLLRGMVGGNGRLEDFVASDLVATTQARDARDTESENCTVRSDTFSDRADAHFNGSNGTRNHGSLPIQSIAAGLAFNEEGTPGVFGLRVPFGTPLRNAEGYDMGRLTQDMEVLDDFKFIEQFCSTSTRGLTDTFDKVKKKSVNATGSGLIEEDDVVDLFDVAEDGDMM